MNCNKFEKNVRMKRMPKEGQVCLQFYRRTEGNRITHVLSSTNARCYSMIPSLNAPNTSPSSPNAEQNRKSIPEHVDSLAFNVRGFVLPKQLQGTLSKLHDFSFAILLTLIVGLHLGIGNRLNHLHYLL